MQRLLLLAWMLCMHGAVAAYPPSPPYMLRFSCGELVVERLDPLVDPGVSQSPHLHQIVGGNSFNTTMDPAADYSSSSSCTTCEFTEDTSNYWTATLYFRARNGTLKRVPTMAGHSVESAHRGTTVYYIPPNNNQTKITAFKKGFRMRVGDPVLRSRRNEPEFLHTTFRCFDLPNFGESGHVYPPGVGTDSVTFPTKPCAGGIRSNIIFPTCWDGKNLDSPDHRSHTAFAINNTMGLANDALCPASHPIRLPQLFLEVNWNTTSFNDPSEWPEDGSQPFVLSTGDPLGYGQHGDYIFGWKDDSLQRAMDKPCDYNCSILTRQSFVEAGKCGVKPKVVEEIDGWQTRLPGDNPITWE